MRLGLAATIWVIGLRAVAVTPPAKTRFAAKFGRIPPQAEARTRVVEADLAAHVMKCVEIGQCARVHTAATAATVTSAPTDAQLRLRAKYGVTAPSQPARQERLLVASADMGGCEHECCRHGE
jgi:hypothetical protein